MYPDIDISSEQRINNMNKINIHIHELFVLLKRLLLLIVLFSIMRIFFYIFNTEHFIEINFPRFLRIMTGGVKFDISAIMFINALYILLYLLPFSFKYNKKYQLILKYLFLISNSIAVAINTADIFYFDYILKRTTADVFMFAGEGNILKLFSLFIIDFWYGTLLGIILITSFILIHNRIKLKKPEKKISRLSYSIFGTVILVTAGYFSVIGMRGSFVNATFPITVGDAGKYTNKPIEMAIVLNTPFSIIKTIERKPLLEKKYFKPDELRKIYSPVKVINNEKEFRKLNLVIIIMESFSREYTGSLNPDIQNGKYKGYTPFLDSIIRKSKVFTRAFANGRQSIEALPAIVASIPTVEQAYVSSAYASNNINTIADLLSKEGYNSSFFHGAPNGAMGLEAFMKIAGYDNFYGMSEYNNNDDFNGSWGIWDEEFFQFFAGKLNTFKQPFNTTFFSLSSHHPFKIPERYEGKFQKGEIEIHRSVRYADYSLQKFFETAKKSDWYKNTLFVITADHASQSYLKKYHSSVGNYAIPIIYFCPSDSALTGIDSTVTQQADIMPTVLNYLNYKGKFVSYGNDTFNNQKDNFAFNYLNNTFQLISGNYVLQFSNDKSIALYNYEKDYSLTENVLSKKPNIADKLEKKIKALIQDYNYRMIHNKLTVE
ncbi:MAG: sulfatase-like hydrolase/transferase [Bacteroidales bacterium]|nr:sulfatase-like hydrolase/transferase [Bacteroidales bacterium]